MKILTLGIGEIFSSLYPLNKNFNFFFSMVTKENFYCEIMKSLFFYTRLNDFWEQFFFLYEN